MLLCSNCLLSVCEKFLLLLYVHVFLEYVIARYLILFGETELFAPPYFTWQAGQK